MIKNTGCPINSEVGKEFPLAAGLTAKASQPRLKPTAKLVAEPASEILAHFQPFFQFPQESLCIIANTVLQAGQRFCEEQRAAVLLIRAG